MKLLTGLMGGGTVLGVLVFALASHRSYAEEFGCDDCNSNIEMRDAKYVGIYELCTNANPRIQGSFGGTTQPVSGSIDLGFGVLTCVVSYTATPSLALPVMEQGSCLRPVAVGTWESVYVGGGCEKPLFQGWRCRTLKLDHRNVVFTYHLEYCGGLGVIP